MGRSSVYSGNSSSTVSSSGWSRASGLSDVSEKGVAVKYRDVGKMNFAQKLMAWTAGVNVDSRKHHKVRAEMVEWQGIDANRRVVTWYTKPELYWTTKVRYEHDDDKPRRPKSKASSRGRQMPGPQARPAPGGPMGPGGKNIGAFNTPGARPGPGPGAMPMPVPLRPPPQQQQQQPPPPPPPPQQHFYPTPGPPPMPQGGPWPQPAGFQGEHDDGSSYTSEVSSSYASSDDGLAYGGPVDPNYAARPPPPTPGQFHHAGGPPPPVANNFSDGTAFIKL